MDKVRLAVVGLGKMGLSHLSMINAHPAVTVAAVCDPATYMLDVLSKYTGVRTFSDFDAMLREVELDAVIIATPSSLHARLVSEALGRGLHVFCEKPFCLDYADSTSLADLANAKGVVSQVGYHCRFIGAFQEVKRLLELGAIGRVTHVLAETYGPVVLQPKRSTWRTQRQEGGGCLYHYAAHPLNLLNWYFGKAKGAHGCRLTKVFSADTDDQVLGSLQFEDTIAQLCVDWSDESYRKMSVKVSIWGSAGRIYADRQECQVYLRDSAPIPAGYRTGWNVRYTTDLTQPVWFYVRGEEYSAQLDHFIRSIADRTSVNVNSFSQAALTDHALALIVADAAARPPDDISPLNTTPAEGKRRSVASLFKRRLLS